MQVRTEFPSVPFTWGQTRRLGCRRWNLDAAVRERTLLRLFTGVYVRADVELTPVLRAQAALLVMSRHSVLCDRSAAWIHGVDVHRFRERDVVPQLESYVLRGHDPTDRPECNGGTRDLLPVDWMTIGGVRVTTPLRTAMDLGCKLSRRDALAAMDALARIHGITLAEMLRLLPRYFRRRGVVQLRELIPLVDGSSESPGESWTRLEILDRGLPSPRLQHWVCVDGVPTYRLDLAYPHARVAIEYDGEEFHSSPADREADRVRRAWLREQGWTVIVVTKHDFTPDATDRWIREVRDALGLR
ncbi:DUF559 domain-containing protein [Nocardioides sp. MAHUQ-72]|uniref:DUF559 domain-containing protein n=1 Tax=unclassified Nocardioides TaxID=2615069 RepID=UPI0036166F80